MQGLQNTDTGQQICKDPTDAESSSRRSLWNQNVDNLIIFINFKRSPDKTTLASGGDDNNLVLLDLRKY